MSRKLRALIPLLLLVFSRTISVYAQAPVAGFMASDTIVCINNVINFTDTTITSGSITNYQWTFGDGNSASTPNPNHNYSTGGQYTVTLIVTDNLGQKDTATGMIWVLSARAVQNIVRICSPATTATISAYSATAPGVSGTWFTASSAVIANAADTTTQVSNLVSGSYIFYWVVSDGFCSAADQVTVIVDQPIAANAGSDQTICVTAGSSSLSGNNPNPGNGLWTTTSSAVIANPNNRNSNVSNLTTPGVYTFVWTITRGACVTSDTMSITVSAVPTVNAGTDQTSCSNNPIATLTGNNPSPGTGLWTTSSSANIAAPTSSTTNVSALPTGISTFIYTITNGACIGRDTVAVNTTAITTANAGVDRQVCTSTGTVTVTGNNPGTGTPSWSAVTSGTVVSPTSQSTSITGLTSPGFYSFVYTITVGTCVSRDTMVVIVRAPVTANAGSDQNLCAITTTTLSGNSAAPGTGLWTTTSTATITTPSSASSGVTNLANGNNTFIWTTTYGACVSRDTVIVRVDTIITPNAGTDQQVCQSVSSVTLTGNNPSPATGLWTKTNGGTITSPTSSSTAVTALTPGVHGFIWTITNGSCIRRDTVNITVNALIPANAGLDQQICQGTTTALSGNNPSPASGLWTTSSTAVIANPSNPSSNISGLSTAGIYSFIWTVTNGACIQRDTMRITADSLVVANAGSDQTYCSATSANLNGNVATPGTGIWTTTGTATITTPSSPTSSVTNLATGDNRFVWTITNGQCTSRDTVVIHIDTPVTANAGSDQNVCITNGTTVLNGNSPSPGSALWTTSSSATIVTPNSSSTTVNGMTTAGTYSFIYTITNGSCITRDTVIITVNAVVTSNAGTDQSQCGSTTATLNGNSPIPGTGLWTTTSSATISSPSLFNSGITNLASGNNQFIWTITNGACISRDTVIIRVDSLINANAGSDQQVCVTTGTATLSGNPASPGTSLWTTTSAATIVAPASASTPVNGLTTAGTYSFIYTITNGSCTSRDTLTITVNADVTANAGSDQSQCGTTTATLGGNSPLPGNGLWSTSSSAIITTPTAFNSGVTNLAAGSNQFIWTITNGACVSRDTVSIRVDSLIIANAGSDQQICATTGSVALAGNSPASGSCLWTTTSSAVIANPNSASTTVSGLSTAGTYTFIYTITNGGCISRDTIIITVNDLITSNAGADQVQCSLTTASLAANTATPGNGLWTTNGSSVITANTVANSTVSNLTIGDNLFIWTITNGACVSSDTVVIHVDSLITSSAGSDQNLCLGNPVNLNANSPLPGNGQWTALNGGTFVDSSLAATVVNGITVAGSYDFVWTIANGSCISQDTVNVAVSDLVMANAGSDLQLCQNQPVILNANTPSSGTGNWTAINGGTITNAASPSTGVTGLNTGTYNFVWTIVNGSCTSTDTVSVTIDSLVNSNAGSDQVICATAGQVILSATDVTPYTGAWTTNASGSFADTAAATTSFTGLGTTGTWNFIWTVSNGACLTSDTMIVTVDSNIVADAGMDQDLCETTLTTNLAAIPQPNGYWSTAGTAIIADTADATTNVNNLAMGANEFYWTVVNGSCTSVDTVIITVYSQVTAANAGADGSSCSFPGITLAGNSPVVGTGVWSTTGSAIINNPSDSSSAVSGLSGGINEFIWTISNAGCSSSDTVIFTITQSPVVDAGPDHFVTSGATVILGGTPTAVSGIAPLTYQWSPGALVNDSAIANPQYIATASQTFVVTLTDSTGCYSADTVNVYLNNPPVAVNDTSWLCNNSILIATVTANDYDLDGDSLMLSILTPPVTGNAVISSAGTISYTPVSGTAYSDSLAYVICDNNPSVSLCDTAWLIINVTGPPVLSSVSSAVQCYGDTLGGIDLTVVSATFPVTYIWSNADTTEDLTAVQANIYTVDVTDSLGCIATLTDTVDGPVSALLAAITKQNINCYGDSTGAIDLQVSGGSPSYHYLWNTTDTIEDLSTLVAGIYSVLVTDSNGCTITATDTIVQPDSALAAMITVTDVQCSSDSNGVAVVNVSGGTPSYTYAWSNGANTDTLSALPTGIYSLTVTDQNGCFVLLSDTVQALNPPLQAMSVTTDPYCLGSVYGSVSVSVTGGVAPLNYSWSNGDTTSVADSLQAGGYDLTVTDNVGCVLLYSVVLNDTSAIHIAVNDSVLCNGETATLSVINYPGASYQWYENFTALGGDTLNTITVNAAGSYTVTATNACGMFSDGPETIVVNALPVANAGSDISAGCEETVTVSATGGVIYSWSPSNLFTDFDSSTTTVKSESTVNLIVTVTDANGCSASDSILLTVNCDPVVIPHGYSPNGDGVNDFFVINGAARYPESVLQIYNRWGNLVYEMSYYDNTWNGLSNVSMTAGDELPDGTYFYVYDQHDGSEVHHGYVVIRR